MNRLLLVFSAALAATPVIAEQVGTVFDRAVTVAQSWPADLKDLPAGVDLYEPVAELLNLRAMWANTGLDLSWYGEVATRGTPIDLHDGAYLSCGRYGGEQLDLARRATTTAEMGVTISGSTRRLASELPKESVAAMSCTMVLETTMTSVDEASDVLQDRLRAMFADVAPQDFDGIEMWEASLPRHPAADQIHYVRSFVQNWDGGPVKLHLFIQSYLMPDDLKAS